jgi:hypothetical protein
MDEETLRMVRLIGLQLRLTDTVLLATVNGMNAQNRVLADKLPSLTPTERQVFLDAISRNETALESLEATSRDFQSAFEAWLKSH